ncbi:MAG: hypothetical protein HFACDABA_02746 [Anaerolineales bacterium]|nr:hypothetical protein [Anaerolineales bacterium]
MQSLLFALASCALCLLAGFTIGATWAWKGKTPVFHLNYITALLGLLLAGLFVYRLISICG